MDTRWQEIRGIWKRTNGLWLFAGLALGGLVGFLAGASIHIPIDGWFMDGIWPELIGIGITVFVLNNLTERRALRQYKEQLVRNAGSRANATTVSAVSEMRKRGWLTPDDSEQLLKGAELVLANLSDTDLSAADLEGAQLIAAHLEETILSGADLRGAELWSAHLEEAMLSRADLRGANLLGAQMSGSRLFKTHLEDANLYGAQLSGAHLRGAIFSEDTCLPDGTYWSPDITNEEMTERFGVVFEDPLEEMGDTSRPRFHGDSAE